MRPGTGACWRGWQEGWSGSRNSRGKGPEVESCLACVRNSEEPRGWRGESRGQSSRRCDQGGGGRLGADGQGGFQNL